MRTRPLVEGALLAALSALLGLLAFYTGFGWLQPIPVLLAYLRHGFRTAALVTVVTAAVLAPWTGPLAAAAALGFTAALGLAPGWALRRGAGAAPTVAVMSVSLAAVALLGAVATTLLWHDNVWADLWSGLHGFLYSHADLLRASGMDPAQAEHAIATLLPVGLLLAAVGQSAAVYGLSSAVLGRLGQPLPSVPPFASWRAPRWLVWMYAAAMAVVAWASRFGYKGAEAAGWNLLAAVATAYSVVGVAAAYGWLRRRGVARGRAVVLTVCGAWVLSAVGLGLVLPVAGLIASHWWSPPTQD